ncbi:hypothetical protein AMELA_G00278220 [Ameiurus melas]|uniref:Cadherin Y-type LIR-motif domain-containing protein n=1 Tax=Ameiurus melas TaxID=219545 RepID=A0A7J5ZK36_AMEME|nr:hypothetical protein AMELA_G00278220 [Ameiurus melas]
MLLLIPLLLLLCQCGAAGLSGSFADIPYDTKEHLISYQTEGQGEDRDVNILMSDIDGPGMMNLNMVSKCGFGATMAGTAFGAAGGAGAGYMISTMNGGGHHYNQMEMTSMDQGMSGGNLGMMRDEYSTYDSGMALDEGFLNYYYSNKSHLFDTTHEDNLRLFGFEGQDSPAGSVGCCSDFGSDDRLDFLNDLGPKFTTLAEICGGTTFTMAAPTPPPPPPPKPIMDHSHHESISTHTNIANTVNMATVAAPPTMHSEENVVVTNTHVVSDMLPVQTLIDVPPQTLRVQQQQPMYYMVEPQVSNTVLLAESHGMGLTQGMYVLNGAPMTERVLVQGAGPAQGMIGGGDRVLLFEAHGGSTTALNTGMLQSAQLSGSQLFMVDSGAQGGQVLQGTLQTGGMSGSQGIMLMEGQGGSTINGSHHRNVPVSGASQSMLHLVETQGGTSGISYGSVQGGLISTAMSQNGSIGLNTSTVHGYPSSQKVVVQEKKVVKTKL